MNLINYSMDFLFQFHFHFVRYSINIFIPSGFSNEYFIYIGVTKNTLWLYRLFKAKVGLA